MTPLTHSTPHQDLRDWREKDARVKKFKESQWERTEGFEPFRKFVKYNLYVAITLSMIIYGISFYLSKQNEKEMDRYLLEWHNHKILKR